MVENAALSSLATMLTSFFTSSGIESLCSMPEVAAETDLLLSHAEKGRRRSRRMNIWEIGFAIFIYLIY